MKFLKRTHILFSEGTRIAADIYLPVSPSPGPGFPAILMCHGWGGIRSQLAPFAEALAATGLAVMTFDYRGWGESDGRVIATRDAPRLLEAGEFRLTVRVLREVVDPVDQVCDANNCFAALAAEPGIDPSRIGVWGTSFGGGHAVFLAGTNPLVKAVVAQVGGFGLTPQFHEHARARAVQKVRAELDSLIPQGNFDALPSLSGSPDVARMLYHSPLAAAAAVRVPTLIVDVEEEELVDRLKHGHAAYEIIRQNAISEYHLLPGKHYDIYDRHLQQSFDMAQSWFQKFL
jgi:dienelactone hydrolase